MFVYRSHLIAHRGPTEWLTDWVTAASFEPRATLRGCTRGLTVWKGSEHVHWFASEAGPRGGQALTNHRLWVTTVLPSKLCSRIFQHSIASRFAVRFAWFSCISVIFWFSYLYRYSMLIFSYIYVNSFTNIESSLWKFREFFECISVKNFNGIVNRVIWNKWSVKIIQDVFRKWKFVMKHRYRKVMCLKKCKYFFLIV